MLINFISSNCNAQYNKYLCIISLEGNIVISNFIKQQLFNFSLKVMNYLFLNVFGAISFFQLIASRTIPSAINETIVDCDCTSLNATLCELRAAICGSHVGVINVNEKETTKKFIPIAIVALLIGIIICGTIYLTFYLKRKKSANGKVDCQEQSKPIEELKIHEIKSDGNKKTVTNETKDNGKDQTFYSQSIVRDDQLDEISLSD